MALPSIMMEMQGGVERKPKMGILGGWGGGW